MHGSPFFVGMAHVYTDDTASSLKGNSAAFRVRLVPLNVLKTFCPFLIDYGQTFVALLPVATPKTSTDAEYRGPALKQSYISLVVVVSLSAELPLTCRRGARDMTVKVFYEAMHKILGSRNNNARELFQGFICEKSWICHPAIPLFCCGTPEGKDMFGAKHSGTVHSFIQCLVRKDVISALTRDATRYETDMCNTCNKLRALLNEAVLLHGCRQKTAASENANDPKHHYNNIL